jgi:hypothetical protein
MRLAPPLSNGEGPPPDAVETLLHAYFRAALPDPWPAPPLPRVVAAQTLPVPAGHGLGRSRLAHSRVALAASVALILGGTLALPSRPPTNASAVQQFRLLPGEATRIRLTETLIQSKDKPTEWRIQVTEDRPQGK